MPLSVMENYLEAIRYGNPEYVPMTCEPIWHIVSFDDIMRMENWTDRFGVSWVKEMDGVVPFPKGNPITNIEAQIEKYRFPDPDELVMDPEAIVRLNKVDRGNMLVMGHMYYFCFERAWALMGLEHFMTAIYEFPDLVRYLLHEIAKYARGVFDRYLEIGVDAVGFTEDLGTQKAMMMSPGHVRDLLLPEYRYAFENVLKEKKIIFFHSCGCVNPIVNDLADAGVTILNPVQTRANDLYQVKRDAFGKMALEGGVDSHLIMTGTPEDVRREVTRVMEILKPGGGYICGMDHFFPDMPKDNVQALWETAKNIGRYIP